MSISRLVVRRLPRPASASRLPTKEIVGGFVPIDVADREAAIARARRILDVSGDGTCHLHEIVEGPPDET